MKKLLKNSAISTLGFLLVMAFSPLASAAENPFGMSKTITNMHVASNDDEGKCGDSMKKAMKDGKCGDSMKKAMKDGKCGDSKKKAMKDGKCGEGKCGDSKKKAMKDGKCGDSMKKDMKDDSKCGGN